MAQTPASIWRNPIHFIAFGFGAGASPWAPGTMGTLVGVLLYWPLSFLPLMWYALVTLVCFMAGVWLCGTTERDLGVPDHSGIVWDEIVGFFITMFALPHTWFWVIAGFVLFRVFDILKPPPIRWLETAVPGGWGVMIDDAFAGILACVILHILYGFVG